MKKLKIFIIGILCCLIPIMLFSNGHFQKMSAGSTVCMIIGPIYLPDEGTLIGGGDVVASADYSSSNLKADTPYADGALRSYSSLGIYNTKRDTTYSSFTYLSFCRYFKLYRSDGRPIYDDDGILDVTWDKTTTNEIVNYPSYLKGTYTTLPSNNKGFLWTTLQARLKNGNWNVQYYNGSTYLGSNSKGLPTNPSNTVVTLPTIMEKDFSRSYSNSNLFCINATVTGYWENTFWGGTGDNKSINENVSGFITVANRDWSNTLTANSNIGKGTYNGRTAYYSPKEYTVVATNLNNYIKVNDVQATPKYGTSIVPYRDGHHITLDEVGYTKIDIENGSEGSYTTYYCFVDSTLPDVSYNYHNANATTNRVVGNISTGVNGAKSQTIYEGVFKDQVQVNFGFDENVEAPETATYTFNGQTKELTSGTWFSQEGDYVVTIKDLAGNTTTSKFTIDKSNPISNLNKLQSDKSYKITKWYLSTIPTGYQGSGSYSFATEKEAIEFAYTTERKNKVTAYYLSKIDEFKATNLIANGNYVKLGEYWYYKSYDDPNLYVYYFDEQSLISAIHHYSDKFVSEAQRYKINSGLSPNNYGNTISDDVYDNIILSNGTKAYIANNFIFRYKDDNDTYKLSCKYLEDTNSNWKTLIYNKAFSDMVNSHGLYLIREEDFVGHITEYYVFYDCQAPMLDIEAKIYGKDKWIEQTISVADIPNNNDLVYYYEDFKIKNIVEDDKWWILELKCPDNKVLRYTYLDELPEFSTLGSGEFTLTLADRVGNTFKFKLYLLGKAPEVKFETINANTQIQVKITTGESYNTLTDLKIYRNGICLNSEAGYDELPEDETNALIFINTNTLKYVFSRGGIYTVDVTDNFGRTLSYEYKFEKDLPSGILVGVTHNGKTKDEVKFIYDTNKYFVVIDEDNQNYECDELVDNNLTTLVFNPKENSEHLYNIKLIDKLDTENYNIYSFTIKTIKPIINLYGVEPNGTTGGNVYATWETNEEQYTASSTHNGTTQNYRKGQILSIDGSYSITLSDEIGNSNTVNFNIDKTIDFTIADINGKTYEIEDIKYINFDIRLIEKEPLDVTITHNGNPYEYEFGLMITDEGEYIVKLYDEFNNSLFFTFTVDKTPPVATLYGVELFGKTNGSAWVVSRESNLSCWYVKDQLVRNDYKLGTELTTNGKYVVYVADLAKNYISFEFEIDKEIAYDINTYRGGISNGNVRLIAYENLQVIMYYNNKLIDYSFEQILKDDGEYSFTLIDELGNKTSSFFTIITKKKQNLNHILQEDVYVSQILKDDEDFEFEMIDNKLYLYDEGHYLVNVIDDRNGKNYSFEITLDTTPPTLVLVGVENGGTTKNLVSMKNISEKPTELEITVDGVPFEYKLGDEIEKCGRFNVELSDEAGNKSTYTFERLYSLNGSSIAVLAGLGVLVVLVIILLVKSRHRYYKDEVVEDIEETIVEQDFDDGEDIEIKSDDDDKNSES